jgi:hypothetical protein
MKIYLVIKGRIFGLEKTDKDFITNLENQFIIFDKFDYSNDNNNTFEYLNSKYDIKCILTLQGKNKDDYFSNRVLENITKGFIGISNSPAVKKYFKNVIYFDDNNIKEMFRYLEYIHSKENIYHDILNKQVEEFYSKFYGYNTIINTINFLKQIEQENNTLLTINNDIPFKLWLSSDDKYKNRFFKNIKSNDDLLEFSLNPCYDLIITNDDYKKYDKFIILNLILNDFLKVFAIPPHPKLIYHPFF